MQNRGNTDYLWRVLITLISIFLSGIVVFLLYLPLRPSIDSFFNRPKFDKDKLAEIAFTRNAVDHDNWNRIENGIHVKTGLVYDANFKHIQASCISCHSSKLITQNRADRSGWKQMIVWMQETQGLPDLGYREPFILDYLSTHYAPKEMGRRPNLDMEKIEWYILEL